MAAAAHGGLVRGVEEFIRAAGLPSGGGVEVSWSVKPVTTDVTDRLLLSGHVAANEDQVVYSVVAAYAAFLGVGIRTHDGMVETWTTDLDDCFEVEVWGVADRQAFEDLAARGGRR